MENQMEIGIPRALSFYTYYPFWHGFFEGLGIKVILSDPTTKKTLSEGAALVVSETCLPVKVYAGHVLNLIEKGVKKIFVPSIQSIAPKIYNCSKIRGLPDIIRNVIKADFEMIEATYDKSALSGLVGSEMCIRDRQETVKKFRTTLDLCQTWVFHTKKHSQTL